MSTIPTQNPVPSEAAKDLKFNSGKIDEFVTSNNHFYTDRFGKKHYTIDGINYLSKQAMQNYGYITKKSFESGNTIINPNDVLLWESNGEYYRWDGELPKVVGAGSTPESAGGIGDGKWKGVGDSSLRSELADINSETLIAGKKANELVKGNDSAIQEIKELKKRVASLHPSIPTNSNSIKLIMRSGSEPGFNIISKKARDRGGYIKTTISNVVAPADSTNMGGVSPWRPNTVTNVTKCYVGNTVAVNTAGGVTQPALSNEFIYSVYGLDRSNSDSTYYAEKTDCSASSLNNPKIYSIPKGGFVDFRSEGDTIVKLGLSKNGSDKVSISVRTPNWSRSVSEISTKIEETSEPTGHVDIHINNPVSKGGYIIRISNKTTSETDIVYVAGCNILELRDCTEKTYFTNSIAYIASDPNKFYRKSYGANEFAISESGVFFGTFHGGHNPLLERLRCGSISNYDLNAVNAPNLLLTNFVSLYSASELTNPTGTATYNVILNWIFSDGAEYCNYSIKLKSGEEGEYGHFFTHMNTTYTNFDNILHPVFKLSTNNGDNPVGDCNNIYQQSSMLSVYSLFTQLDQENNYLNGANIQKTINFNKQYYGTCMGGGKTVDTIVGDYVTYKEFF